MLFCDTVNISENCIFIFFFELFLTFSNASFLADIFGSNGRICVNIWSDISLPWCLPLGERTLPDEYIRLQKKPDNLTWDEFTVLARKQFKIDQENELKRLKDKKQQQLVFRNAQTILQAKLDAKRKANKQLQLQKQKDEEEWQKQIAENKKKQEEEEQRKRDEEEWKQREEEEHKRKEEEAWHKEEEEQRRK